MYKILLLLFLFSISSYASSSATVADYAKVISDGWMSFFHLIDGFKWMLAIAPMILAGWAISQARKKLIKDADQTQMSQSGNLSGGTVNVDIIKVYVSYIVGSIISLYIMYGTFGIVFADATSYKEVWDELVVKFWKDLFGVT